MAKFFFYILCFALAPLSGCALLASGDSDLFAEAARVERAKLARPDYADRDKTGWTGFDYEIKKGLGQPMVLVTKVYENSPAEKCGLAPGDIIYHVIAYDLRDFDILVDPVTKEEVVGSFVGPPGMKINVYFDKAGDKRDSKEAILKLEKRPQM